MLLLAITSCGYEPVDVEEPNNGLCGALIMGTCGAYCWRVKIQTNRSDKHHVPAQGGEATKPISPPSITTTHEYVMVSVYEVHDNKYNVGDVIKCDNER